MKPITPDQVTKKVPDDIISCFNKLIRENWDGIRAEIKQDTIVSLIADTMEVDRQTVFAKKWLDIESLCRAAGWRVKYDKPAYCETYKAYFVFSKKKES